MEQFDVIVVGASVSGSPTAMLFAREGFKILLIDKKIFPRDTLSTHFIWPRGLSYLHRWGIAESILQRTPHFTRMEVVVEGIRLYGSVPLADVQTRFKTLHGNADGATDVYCGPRRLLLDHALIKAAATAGADVRQGVTFTRPIVENDEVRGIHAVTQQGTPFEARARLVIGADGRFSGFAKAVGAPMLEYRSSSTFAHFGYFSGIRKDELTIRNRGRLGTAIFPTSDGTHMVLVYGPNSWWSAFRGDAEANFFKTYEFCDPETAEKVRGGRREEPFKAYGTMPVFQRQNVGRGWALIGDAGSCNDQVTAMGITHAFRDAELISHTLGQGLDGKLSLDQSLEVYRAKRANDYEEYFDFVCDVAKMKRRSRTDLRALYDISIDAQKTNEFLARFGDTCPMVEQNSTVQPNTSTLPGHLAGYHDDGPGYEANLYVPPSIASAEAAPLDG
ncbi:Flavoprotein monooxygenase [Paraburkholderia ribeironis]|uniref:Flavoprotein monooxygenase n=1 Tax=Paraburkholderia ribeironis TaxID=1247936 RepID=A0A1N7SPG6_9BURK|nr:NAD(P)/FAD-dependent oxidoreductase [Paraburkholderia ribeironis]SIT49236.1 Flavoprotein monooxygenase [Paraburkholderia ribeironis]